MKHHHKYDQLTLIRVLPQIQDKRGVLTLFNKPSALIGYQCGVEEKAELGGRTPCEAIEPRYYGPLHEMEAKLIAMQKDEQ